MFETGVFLVDKPAGPTSFRIVQQVRRALQIKKVGHSGTLDPFASGLLIICVGRPATRMISRLMCGDKVYDAKLRLGVETDTLDLEGRVLAECQVPTLDMTMIEACLDRFRGEQMQVPPAFSAVKHEGKPLYQYARQGVVIEKPARPVLISELICTEIGDEEMGIRVRCSKGTYIRTLAADIGRALGCGAHLTALRRLDNGPFSVSAALPGTILDNRDEARSALLAHCMSLEEIDRILRQAEMGFNLASIDH
jgi:tRNA pseudouridine55 synthase